MPASLNITREGMIEREVAAIVRGEPCVPSDPAAFVATALLHRMGPLVVHAGGVSRLPRAGAAPLVENARNEAVVSELRDRELCRVLCALGGEGIDVLVMKGAHLAHSHYAETHLRPRDDADLLIAPGDGDRVSTVLERAGYERLPDITADIVHGQMLFAREENIRVVLDVHLRIAAPLVAADLLSFDALSRRAVRLPRLGPCARVPAPVDALALACIHQSAHHPEREMLLWMYDIFLLLSRFTAAEREEFSHRAVERRMARVCAHAIAASAEYFPVSSARAILDRLRAADGDEPSAFLVGTRTPLRQLASDLAFTRTWRSRARLLLAHLFPPPNYMRHMHGGSSAALLPWLYVNRILRGSTRWLSGKTRDD
jgi:hypothetical protein